jgi:RNA-directed DNA polymerase
MGLFNFLKRIFIGDTAPPLPRPRAVATTVHPSASWNPPVASGKPAALPEPRGLENLDDSPFTALSDADLKKKLQGKDVRRNLFVFGLQNQIPPISDERTLLIDRALVGQGLLTPEELAEIHKAGEEYSLARPKPATAWQRGDLAVAADKAEREALKQQRKAEAAGRRQQRAEAIARRKATDIVFLGRGVSGGLADRRANIEKLARFALPVLATPQDLAQAMGLEISRLRWLAFHADAATVSHYVRFQIAKKSGGVRELAAPHVAMKQAQHWILETILWRVPMHEAAHGFVDKRSIMSNAVPHVGKDIVINADLKDFFPTITFPRVKGIFQALGYSPCVSTILALICTECPRQLVSYAGTKLHVATGPRALPQGAPTSPALSNIAARRLDLRLTGFAKKLGWTYTRYADDITFSASGEPTQKTAVILTTLRHITREEKFTVNEKKTRVQRQNRRQEVTGIVVNDRPNAPRETYRRLRAILHNAKKTGLEAQNIDGHDNFPSWLGGMISYIHMTNPERGKVLWDALRLVS